MTMTPYERLKAMVEKREVDRPGVSVWKHFFLDDRYVSDHVKRTIAFQDMNDWDFIKIMTTNVHMEAQFGAAVKWTATEGDRTMVKARPIKSPHGFRTMKAPDVTVGALGKEIEVAKRLADHYHGRVPVIATVDTPASYLKALYCGFEDPSRFGEVIRYYQDDLKEGLKVMTEVTVKLTEEYAKAGVDGIFFATNVANEHYMTEEEYKELLLPSDLETVKAAEGKTWFNILHIHGDGEVFFDLLANALPVQAVNWHTVTTTVSLKEGAQKTDKILIGGVDHMKDFAILDREELVKKMRERVKDAADSIPANRLIIATGCSVIPPSIPDARIGVLKDVVDEVYGR